MDIYNSVKKRQETIIAKSTRKFVRAMKLRIRKMVHDGSLQCYLSLREANITNAVGDMEIKVYLNAATILNTYYKGNILIEIDDYGYCNSHKQLKATVVQKQ